MKQSAKRLCSLLMVLCLLVGLIPFSALATEATDSGVEFLYQQLTLGDDLTMNFEIALDEAVAAQAVVNLTVDGTVTPYTVNEMTANENGNYLFSVDVAAAQMTKDINVAVTVDGTAIAERTYTVRAYADAILNGNYSKEAKDLVKEMLNYGAKAQAYFDYNVEALADAGLEAVTPAVMPTEAPEIAVEGKVAGISYYGSSMLFTGKLAVRYYFTAPNGVEGYTFAANGNSYEAKQKDSLYYVDVAGINPQDIDESVVLTVSKESSSLSISYGPMNYITRMWNGKGSESLNTLLQAMYGYHLAAEAYVINGELESTYPAILPNYELNREQNQLEVMAFWTPPINEEQYTWMKEAGITSICLDNKYGGNSDNLPAVMELCNKLDIDVYVTVFHDDTSATWPGNFAHYLDNPNFKGFYVDEPQTQEQINNIAAMYKAADAMGLSVIVNRMPWTDAEYDAWFNEAFADSNKETLIISSTNYPLMTDSVRDEWLEVNGLTNEMAATNNAEYWQFVATCGYGSGSGERRQVTEADIRWQYYAALAYGPTGIQDFVYTTVIPGGEFNGNQHGAIWWTDVDDWSTYYKTDVYYALQAVNQEIAKFDHVLLSYDWQGVMVNAVGSNSYTTAALNNAPGKLAQHDRISSISSTKDLLVGCFEDANNYDGFLLVNFDETLGGNTATNTVSVNFNKAYTAVAYVKGERQVVTLENGVYTCELKPGEAVFVIPVEGDVELQPSELAIPADAIMVDDFSDCAVYQDVAGVKALTDGAYTDVLPASYDYSLFSHIIFRMKAAEGATITVGGQALNIANTDWNDVSVTISTLSGNDVVVTGNVWIDQIFARYIPSELPIPEDATLVTDFSVATSPWNSTNYGSGAKGTTAWYAEYDGVAGVQAFGMQENSAIQYTLWTEVLPADFDYSAYTHITLRLKVDKNAARALYLGNTSTLKNFLSDVSANGEWTTVTLKIEDLSGYFVALANNASKSGEMVWIDQVYVRSIPDELPIPEGATLVTDYSTAASPWNNPNWGSKAVGITAWHDAYDGVAGVQAFGMQANTEAKYTMWTAVLPSDFDFSSYDQIHIRLKIDKSAARAIYLGNTSASKEFLSSIPVSNEWTTVTLDIADLPGFYLMLSNVAGKSGEMLWIDQVWVTSVTEWTVSITDGSMDYDGEAVPDGTTITLTHDSNATPEYYEFSGWKVNGNAIEGNTVTVDQNMTIEPIYVLTVNELPIPEGATLVSDFSANPGPWNSPNYGSGAKGTTAWYEEYDGVAGVQAFGMQENSGVQYTLWSSVLPSDFDYTGYTHITLRLKVDKTKTNAVYLGTTSSLKNFLPNVSADGEWTTVTLKISDLAGYFFALSNKASCSGEMVWIDQVYVEKRATELAIPEGATLVSDFSANPGPWNSPNYGSGAKGTTAWYEEYDGVAGVQAFGMQENSGVQYTLWSSVLPSDFDYTGYTHITLRLKVDKTKTNAVYLGTTSSLKNFLPNVSADGEWTTVTLKISDLAGYFFALSNKASCSGEMVWIDQVYVEKRATELAIPEGATLVTDYSTAASPWNSPYYGAKNVGTTAWYEEYDGVAGVQAFGKSADGYTLWTNVLPSDFDYSAYTHITLRLKVDKSKASHLLLGTTSSSKAFLPSVTEDNAWTTVTLKISELPGYFLILNNVAGTTGEMVWIDQVYVTAEEEWQLPEGATLVTDFSTAASPWNNPNWGSKAVGVTAWYSEYDGETGVQAFGMQENTAIQYTMWTAVLPSTFDYSGYTTITLRLKVDKSACRAVYLGNTSSSKQFIESIPASNEWTTVTLNIADLPGYYLMIANNANKSGEMLWIDAVYVQ